MKIVHPCFLVFLLGGLFALESFAADCPDLLYYGPINLDATANTASTVLQLRNSGQQPISYVLSISDFRSKNSQNDNGSAAVFYGSDGKPAGSILIGKLAPNSDPIAVRVDFTQLVEAGESEAELRCNDQTIAKLKSVKMLGLPFRVTLEGNPVEKPVIAFVRDVGKDLYLKNDDAVTYPVLWELSLKDKVVSNKATLLPNGITEITVRPDQSWFSKRVRFFKDEQVDGRFLVRYAGESSQQVSGAPSKSLPIAAHLSFYPYEWRDTYTVLVILGVLRASLVLPQCRCRQPDPANWSQAAHEQAWTRTCRHCPAVEFTIKSRSSAGTEAHWSAATEKIFLLAGNCRNPDSGCLRCGFG